MPLDKLLKNYHNEDAMDSIHFETIPTLLFRLILIIHVQANLHFVRRFGRFYVSSYLSGTEIDDTERKVIG